MKSTTEIRIAEFDDNIISIENKGPNHVRIQANNGFIHEIAPGGVIYNVKDLGIDDTSTFWEVKK